MFERATTLSTFLARRTHWLVSLVFFGGLLGFSRPVTAQGFGPTPSYGAPSTIPVSSGPLLVVVADLNHDNKLDLVLPSYNSGVVDVLLGDGAGGFTAAPGSPIGVGSNPYGAAVGDLNGDTHPDIVIPNAGSNNVSVLLGDGTGAFTAAAGSPLTAGTTPSGVAIANINADAIPDLIVANRGSNNVSRLLGTGTGAFGAPTNFAVGPEPTTVAVGDLNNDGFKDLVTNNFTGTAPNNISVLIGTAGGFAAAVNYASGAGAETVTMADLNADGKLDVLVANVTPGTLSVLLGNGNGTLQAAVNYTAGAAASAVAAGDFNADGKLDAGVVNFNAASATLFTGDGSGALQAPGTDLAAGTQPVGLGVGDFNGDGKADLAVPNFGSNNLMIFLNTISPPSADLAITKAGPGSVIAGQTVVYTTTVTNNGPGSAAAVSVADPTPSGLTFVSNTGACTTTFPCALGTVTNGQVRTITSTYLVPSSYAGPSPIQNTATVSSSTTDPTPGNDSATASSTTVGFSANLAITKTGPGSVAAGQNVVYTITVTNNGPSDAAVVSVADTTPSGLTFVSNAGACTTAFPCALGTVTNGQVRTITSTFLVPAGYAGVSPIPNTATVSSTTTDPTPGNNSQTASTPVTVSANLGLTKTGPASVAAGQNVVYTITVTNAGPSNAAAVSVADTTPAGLTFVSNTGGCTTAFPCALGALASGASQTITSTFLVPAGYAGVSPILNTATVSSTTTDPTPANNSQTASTPVTFSADLAITKTGPAGVVIGQNVVYTITVTNNGPSDAAVVSVADPTPSGLTFVSNAGACTTSFPCALGTMTSGQVRTITATFLVPSNFAGANPIQNTATVGSSTTDPAPGNNTATASTTAGSSFADLSITKVGPANVSPGKSVVYTISVTNSGPSDATAVSVTDPTPTGLTFLSNSGDCTTAFPCALGTLSVGASRSITATFTVPAAYAGPDPVVNTASVASSTADANSSNNSASASAALVRGFAFNTLAPCRALDTRDPAGPLGGPALDAGAVRTFILGCGVPATARAVSVNITVTQPTQPGDLRLYPAGSTPPLASAINYGIGQTRANNAVIPLGASGDIDVLCDQGAGTVHFILDVNGYFEP